MGVREKFCRCRISFWLGAGVCLAASAVQAAALIVGERETAELSVDAGLSVELTDAVAIARGGALYKNGAGELVVPDKVFAQENPARVGVKAGTVKVRLEAAENRPQPSMPTALSVAALWLDASRADSLVAPETVPSGQTAPVERWYDARETDKSAPSYMYAVANSVVNWSGGKMPESTTRDGVKSVYFGKLGSGVHMDFYFPGGTIAGAITKTDARRRIWHAFVVYGVYESHGFLFGDPNVEPCLQPGYYMKAENSVNSSFARANGCLYELNARWKYNGSVFDPVTEAPRRGFNLLQMDAGEIPWYAGTIFRERWLHDEGNGYRAGGDYIAEYLVFTNQLNNVQLEQVSAYLTAKWFPTRKAPVEIVMGDAANAGVVTVEAAADGKVLLAGNCDVVKTGAGTATLGTVEGMTWTGKVIVREGRVAYAGDKAAAVVDGETLAKTGTGSLSLPSVPETVRKVSVAAGELVLAGRRKVAADYIAPDAEYEVSFGNPGFETWTAGDVGTHDVGSTTYNNWVTVAGGSSFYDLLACAGDQYKLNGEAAPSVFGLTSLPLGAPNDPDAFTSRTAFFLRSIETHSATYISVSKPGWYELSLDLCGREHHSYAGYLLRAYYMNGAGDQMLADFGHVHYEGRAGFKRKYLKAHVPGPSAGFLHLQGVGSGDISLCLDNVRLRYLSAAQPNETAVPGGDFESTGLTTGDSRSYAKVVSTAWTMTQNADWTGSTPSVGLTCFSMDVGNDPYLTSGPGRYYNNSRGPGYGYGLLYFQAAASAEVSFTPPAGRWQVKAQIASKDYNKSGELTCSVNGTSLGTVKSTRTVFQDKVWPEVFVADGSTPVTLKLTFANQYMANYRGSLFVDNVVLVPAEDEARGAFAMDGEPKIVLGEGATLKLDFTGTNVVSGLRRGGVGLKGLVSAATCDWISGTGVLDVRPAGFSVLVR